jgi:serine protease Do
MRKLVIMMWGLAAVAAAAVAAAPEGINLRRTVTVEVVRKTKDAVVNISATKTVAQRVNPFGEDPFWNPFDNQVVRVPSDSLGSGFIVHPDGYVVTNHHVIDRARKVNVELADGRKLPAELVSSDPDADLAILKIADAKPLPTIELGDSSDLLIGEPVIAVGNPLGFSHSVSTGIISAVHRDLKDQRNKVLLTDLVQTDAAINPGNSGGPLLNAYGQVIAINTAIRGDAQNIGFAIPVNKLRELVPELMNPKQVAKLDIALKLVERRRVREPNVVESTVEVDDEKGGRVAAINGRAPADIFDAYAILLRTKMDQKHVTVKLDDGSVRRIPIARTPLPPTVVEAKKRLGVTIEQVTPMLAEKYQLRSEDGIFIGEVVRDSLSAKAGVKPGDVLIQMGRYRVSTIEDLAYLMEHLPEKGKVRVGIIRGERVGYTVLEFGAAADGASENRPSRE